MSRKRDLEDGFSFWTPKKVRLGEALPTLTVLKKCRLFQDLPQESLEQNVLPRGRLWAPDRWAVLIEPGNRVDWFAVILRGKVRVSQLFADGTGSLMDVLGPSCVLGADLICTRSRRSPYYAVAGIGVELLRFPRELLLEPGGLPETERMAAWRRMLALLADDNLRKHYRLAILAQRGLRDRVLIYLTMQAERREASTFQIPFSREELAEYLCVNRSALSHELSQMEREGLIRFRKNEFTLLPAGRRRSTWTNVEPRELYMVQF